MFKPFSLERYFAAHEFSARHLLCTSDCESMDIGELLSLEPGSVGAMNSTWLGYTESRGNPALREDISNLYPTMRAENVLVHSGAEEAILNFFLALVSKDSTVIVNSPCYQSLVEIPRGLGASVLPWNLRPEKARWRLDPAELATLLEGAGAGSASQSPPIVVLNTPHNPTGALLTHSEFGEVLAICGKFGAILLCDEVYRLLEFDRARRLPSACDVYENAVSLSVLSKAWGLAGLRIGWLASPRRDLLDKIAEVKDYNSICASAPSETLAGIAVRHTRRLTEKNLEICARNRALFQAFFEKHKYLFEWVPPEAGSVAFPRLKNDKAAARWEYDSEKLAKALLAETGVLLLPGAHYSYDKAHFRIGLGREKIAQGLSIFDAWLEKM